MAHLIDTMAYVGQTPWHGLGNQLTLNQPIDTWLVEAGMNWTIESSDVLFNVSPDGMHIRSQPDSKVLYRSDNLSPLSVVSNRYQIVQPYEILHFYKDLVSAGGFSLETAGVLKGGRKLWALASTGQETLLKGKDQVKAYLLLATSCDGTLCTTAQFTSVRVVCNNTLQIAVGDRTGAVKVPHSAKFDPKAVKETLGIGISSWDSFIKNIKELSKREVSPQEADTFFRELLEEPAMLEQGVSADLPESRLSGKGSGRILSNPRSIASAYTVPDVSADRHLTNNRPAILKGNTGKLIRVEAMADMGNSSSNTAAAEKSSLALRQISSLYGGAGRGSMLPSSRQTAWGLMNAVTEYVDHYRRARSQDYRLDSAWFGQGALLKQKAMTQVQTLLQ